MDKEQITRRSAVRVLERSIHGGLGRGNVGVVMARAGVGKGAFLVGVGLDALLQGRKVLHVNTESSADRVREFYGEVFRDLAETTKLEDRLRVHLQIERNRMIHSFLGHSFSLDRINTVIDYMSTHMQFEPSTVIIEGYPDWAQATEEELKGLKDLAARLRCEMWLRARTHREGEPTDARGVPPRIARFEEYISVMLHLQPHDGSVRLQVVKDHDNPELAEVYVELDPRTLLLVWR